MGLMMHQQNSQQLNFVPPAAVSQTPRLEAKKMRSPIMGSLAGEAVKRATSALDLEFDLMGLS